MNRNLSLRRIGAGLALAASAWLAEPLAAVAQTPCPPPTSPCGPPPLTVPALPPVQGMLPSLPPAQGATPGAQPTQPSQPGTQPGQPGTQPSQPGTQPGQAATPPGTDANAQTPTPAPSGDQANTAGMDSGASNAFSQAPLAGTGGNTGSPNMLGDLLSGNRSVSFFVQRANGSLFINGTGATNVTNPKVAENNSPEPRDRIAYRYNFFSNANQVTGQEGRGPFDPRLPSVFGFRDVPIGGFQGIARTRDYNRHRHTFSFEKTFLDKTASVELRVPFQTGLASKLDLTYGVIDPAQRLEPAAAFSSNPLDLDFNLRNPSGTGPIVPFGSDIQDPDLRRLRMGDSLRVISTPDQTLGREDTEWGDMSMIFKAVLYRDACSGLLVSGGLGVQIPTGQDVRVRVVDYEGDFRLNDAELQRTREFLIRNETWSASPFLAALYAPNDRFFVQGFFQVDIPVTSNRVSYSSVFTDEVENPPITAPLVVDANGNLVPDFRIAPRTVETLSPFNGGYTVERRANDQFLMHTDIGAGYWLVRNRCGGWLTGFAPTVELHYTTTLNDADIVALPNDRFGGDRGFVVATDEARRTNTTQVNLAEPPQSTVGNVRNRMDILNMTVGATTTIGDRLTIANGFGFPLRSGDNRTFDWEYQFQLNYYFGGGASAPRFVPNP